MNKIKNNIIIIPILTAIISIVALIGITFASTSNFTKSYSDFLVDKDNFNISKVVINSNSLMTVTLNDGTVYSTDNPNSSSLKEELLTNNINVLEASDSSFGKNLATAGFVISLFSIVFLMINKRKSGNSSLSDMNVTDVSLSHTDYGFHTVAGNEEAKESLMDIVDFLKTPEKYNKYGARMPKGVILHGSPGTGKTLLAKAVAGEAGVPFYALSGSDFVQVYVGVGASRVRSLFKKAKAHGKAVIFIDEIDAIGKTRAGGNSATGGGNDERDQTLNALLTEMSGFGESEGIVVIAATNRLDTLDPALLRPGRFDRHVEVALPDVTAREKIIKLYLDNKPHKDIDISSIAKNTAYFSGAKLESLINEAAILAAKDNSNFIMQKHISIAHSTILAGSQKKDYSSISNTDSKLTAYHEAGHALISMLKVPEDIVSKISIIPTTKGAGGYTLTIPKDSNYQRIDYITNKIMVLLGGRAAEELIFGVDKISTGASSDIGQSTNIAMAMITEYGMGNSLGLLKLSNLGELSSSYGNVVIAECKQLVDKLYEDTLNTLRENSTLLEKIATDLLEKETIEGDSLQCYINLIKNL